MPCPPSLLHKLVEQAKLVERRYLQINVVHICVCLVILISFRKNHALFVFKYFFFISGNFYSSLVSTLLAYIIQALKKCHPVIQDKQIFFPGK